MYLLTTENDEGRHAIAVSEDKTLLELAAQEWEDAAQNDITLKWRVENTMASVFVSEPYDDQSYQIEPVIVL